MEQAMQFNQYGRDLKEMLILRYEPIAIKMIRSEAEIPEGAVDPRKDKGEHLAFCQALAMTRRDKKTVYMDKYSTGAGTRLSGWDSWNARRAATVSKWCAAISAWRIWMRHGNFSRSSPDCNTENISAR